MSTFLEHVTILKFYTFDKKLIKNTNNSKR